MCTKLETNQLKRGASGRNNLDSQGFTKNILYWGEQLTQKGCDSQGERTNKIYRNTIFLHYVKYINMDGHCARQATVCRFKCVPNWKPINSSVGLVGMTIWDSQGFTKNIVENNIQKKDVIHRERTNQIYRTYSANGLQNHLNLF
jgi:hypothetical protein